MAGTPGRSGRRPKLKPAQLRATPGALTAVDPPGWLHGEGRDLWLTLAPMLCAQHTLRVTDLVALEAYCAAYTRFRAAEREISERGILVTGANGTLTRNPAFMISGQATQQMATFGALLGLDPASRLRLLGTAPKPLDDNPFAALLQ